MTHRESTIRITEAIGLSQAPIAVYYSDQKPQGAFEWTVEGGHFCVIGRMAAVRKGTPMAIDGQNPGCMGAAFFLGFKEDVRPGFEYFLSHDSEGKGERYKKTPELARAYIETRKFVPANGRYCIFQRLEDVPEEVTPEVVSIFAETDQIAGLMWLANYGRTSQHAAISPFTAGCGSMVSEARAQAQESEPQAVLGMFDPSARQMMESGYLTFSVPYSMFLEMLGNISGSFLEVDPWLKIRDRK